MANRGAGWSTNANNPNLTPLPPRPSRAGIGAGSPPQHAGPPPLPGPGPGQYPPPQQHPFHHHQHGPPPTHPSGYTGPPPAIMPGGPPGPPPGISPPGAPPSGPPGASPIPAAPLGAPEPATTLFVGSIAAGVTDVWLTRLLEACGQLRQLKRPNKAFGFAEFMDPGSVKRALMTLNGIELPAFDSGAPAKKLLVKADEKTKKYMDGWESDRTATNQDIINDSEAISRVQSIIKRMQDPNARHDGADSSIPAYEIPAHLKDLTSEELPEEHRGSVLSEIEQFRQAAAAREEAARKKEIELEKQRAREREERERGSGSGSHHSSSAAARGDGINGYHGGGHGRFARGQDPQSYNRPRNFVAERGGPASASTGEAEDDLAGLDPEERDEVVETRRKKTKEAEDARAFREAEHRASGRERARISHWERELAREKSDESKRQRERDNMLRLYKTWSEDEAQEKEMFYYDRTRWRHHRRAYRQREQEKDARDQEAESAAAAAAAAEAERFLAQQAAEMAALQERQRAAGILIPASGSGGIRLNIAAKKDGGAAAAAAGGAAGGGGTKISIGLKKGGIGASLVAAATADKGAGADTGAQQKVAAGGTVGSSLVRTSVLGDTDDDDGLRKRKLRTIVLDDEDGGPQAKRR
ncbi:hypothetical protein V8E36_000002 [Tilletia maclaganii]